MQRFVTTLLALLTLASCGRPEPWRQEAFVFGTRVEILVQGGEEATARAAMADVLREFERLHRSYHAWKPSELTALNTAIAAGKPLEVSAEMVDLVRDAQHVAASGNYLFDPGIGRLIALWGFQQDTAQTHLPDEAAIATLLAQHPSIADLSIDGRTISSRNRSVALDFGGYLKGVALDRARSLLLSRGLQHALINIGGNIIALGNRDGRSGGKAWRIGIQHPRSEQVGGLPLASLDLHDGEAIGTSGDYHRYFEIAGRRYCHLIDPRSGRPAESTQAVTILVPPGPDAGMRSDALSKPLFIAGDDWHAMAHQLKLTSAVKIGAGGTALMTRAMHARLTVETPDLSVSTVD